MNSKLSDTFTFFDFCSGIGAGHTALTTLGGSCVGFSEIRHQSEVTYREIHGVPHLKNWGDLTKINPDEIPNFDLMVGGFPCQTFSIVGKREGMEDERGQIIFGLAKILKEKNIKYFLLENVKGLVNHNKGETLKNVLSLLSGIGYSVSWKILKSSDYGIPQIRERIYFVGIKKEIVPDHFEFNFPKPQKTYQSLKELLIEDDPAFVFDKTSPHWGTFEKYLSNKYNVGKYSLHKLLQEDYLILDTRQSDLRLYKKECPTLRTGRHGVLYVKNGVLRKISGKESLLLQGFSEDEASRVKTVSQTELLSQAGNAFTVDVISAVAQALFSQLSQLKGQNPSQIPTKAQLNFSQNE